MATRDYPGAWGGIDGLEMNINIVCSLLSVKNNDMKCCFKSPQQWVLITDNKRRLVHSLNTNTSNVSQHKTHLNTQRHFEYIQSSLKPTESTGLKSLYFTRAQQVLRVLQQIINTAICIQLNNVFTALFFIAFILKGRQY